MIWLWACVLPVREIYRAEVPVFAEAEARVLACTWSHWSATERGCADLVEGERERRGQLTVKEFSNAVTVIFGEAPLMQTLYVACAGAEPRGTAFYAWDAGFPLKVELRPGEDAVFGDHGGLETTPESRAALARAMCAGAVKEVDQAGGRAGPG